MIEDGETKIVLARAMEIIGQQAAEIEAQKSALDATLDLQKAQISDIARMSEEVDRLEKLLHVSDEGLSEALIVLASMREGLKKVNMATTATVNKLSEIGYSPDFTESVKGLTTAVTSVSDEEMLNVHEDYLRDLRRRLMKKKKS